MSLSVFSSVTTSQVHLEIFSIVRGHFFLSLLRFLTTLLKQKSWLAWSKRFAHISHSAVLVERHFLERYWFSHTSPGYIRVSPVGSQAAQWEMEEERTSEKLHIASTLSPTKFYLLGYAQDTTDNFTASTFYHLLKVLTFRSGEQSFGDRHRNRMSHMTFGAFENWTWSGVHARNVCGLIRQCVGWLERFSIITFNLMFLFTH